MLPQRKNPLFSLLAICLASVLVLPCLAASSKKIYFIYTNNTQDTTKENILYWPKGKAQPDDKTDRAEITSGPTAKTVIAPQNLEFSVMFNTNDAKPTTILANSANSFFYKGYTTTIHLFYGGGCPSSFSEFKTSHPTSKHSFTCFYGGGFWGSEFQWYWEATPDT